MKALRTIFPFVLAVVSLVILAVETWRNAAVNILTLTTGLIGIIVLIRMMANWIRLNKAIVKSIQLLTGKKEKNTSASELPRLIEANNRKFKLISEHIKQLGTVKEMPTVDETLLHDEVGKALQSVQIQMKTLKKEEDQQHWIADGLAKFAEVLRKKESIKKYSEQIISTLVKYVGVNQGGLFLEHENEGGERYLELTGSYAYEKNREISKKILMGEGLLGQCMYEKEIIFITDVPKNYVQITSGLGLATPRNVIVVPLMVNENFYGAVELASFQILQDYQLEFLKKVSVMIAAEIGAIKTLEHTRTLLTESDKLSQKLQAQEEELRMNLEELTATQEEMKRSRDEVEKKQAELRSYLSAIDNTIASAEFNIQGNLTNANKLFLTITGYSATDIRGKSYKELFKNEESLQVMWENLQLGKFFSGEFRMLSNDGKELWMNGTLNPIMNASGKPDKVMLFAQFTTQEKEKLNELGGMVNALKQTLPIVECNSDFQCKSANDKFMKLFGVGRLNLKDKKLIDFISDEQFSEEVLTQKSELFTKNNLQITLPFEVLEQIQNWEVSFSIIRDLSGDISRIVMMMICETPGKIVRMAI